MPHDRTQCLHSAADIRMGTYLATRTVNAFTGAHEWSHAVMIYALCGHASFDSSDSVSIVDSCIYLSISFLCNLPSDELIEYPLPSQSLGAAFCPPVSPVTFGVSKTPPRQCPFATKQCGSKVATTVASDDYTRQIKAYTGSPPPPVLAKRLHINARSSKTARF
jgi:hypothetical protein